MIVTSRISKGIFASSEWGNWDIHPPAFVWWGLGGRRVTCRLPYAQVRVASEKPSLPRWRSGEESPCQCRRRKRCRFSLWVGKIPWRRKWRPTSLFLPGKLCGQEDPGGLQSIKWQRVKHDWARISPSPGTKRCRYQLLKELEPAEVVKLEWDEK